MYKIIALLVIFYAFLSDWSLTQLARFRIEILLTIQHCFMIIHDYVIVANSFIRSVSKLTIVVSSVIFQCLVCYKWS